MRGNQSRQEHMFSYVDVESPIPAGHPIRRVRKVVDQALAGMDDVFDAMYAENGRRRGLSGQAPDQRDPPVNDGPRRWLSCGRSGEHGQAQARQGAVRLGQGHGADAPAEASRASQGAMAVSAYGGGVQRHAEGRDGWSGIFRRADAQDGLRRDGHDLGGGGMEMR